ncbi:unnamed protein product [Lactuca virosa]|uniref:Uncharacterized protein n=1 Tax=Lactuca virosa TaxID=75947 RepID=A0AAU9LAA0_9ASTR|nr:unnamed protein product [Lactuca virosa]
MDLDTCHSHVSSTGSALSSPIEFLTSDLHFFCFNVSSIPFTASLFSLLRTLGHVIFPPAPASILNDHPRHFATVSIEPTRRLLHSYQRRLPDEFSVHLLHNWLDFVYRLRLPIDPQPAIRDYCSRQLIWLSDTDRTKGYDVDFFSVSLHEVSRDPEALTSPCIYTQYLETKFNKFFDMNEVDALFEVFCECAELNPKPVEEDEPEEHNWIFSADQLGPVMGIIDVFDQEWDFSQTHFTTIGHPNGHHDLECNVLELQINDQRFEDVEEMESNNRNGGQQ